MKPITAEWIAKAEGDYHSARRELRARTHPNYDATCFHAQQCAEKYLKARLQEANVPFSKTHDLTTLLDQLAAVEPTLEAFRAHLAALNACAVEGRYPGTCATKARAQEMFRLCSDVRDCLRENLGAGKRRK